MLYAQRLMILAFYHLALVCVEFGFLFLFLKRFKRPTFNATFDRMSRLITRWCYADSIILLLVT